MIPKRLLEDAWERACAETPPDPRGAAGDMVRVFASTIDVDHVDFARRGVVALFLLDLGPVALQGMDLNVLMVTQPPRSSEETAAQLRMFAEYRDELKAAGLSFVIHLSPKPLLAAVQEHAVPDMVFLCKEDISQLADSPRPHEIFLKLISKQVAVTRLCPFNSTLEARGHLFKGRETEVERLVRETDTQFLVTGARRIGKTSLLRRAHTLLRRKSGSHRYVFFFDCRQWGDCQDCFRRIAHEIDPDLAKKETISATEFTFMLEKRAKEAGTKVVLFLDEIDDVVDIEVSSKWPFLETVKSACASGIVRVVVAGFRSTEALAREVSYREVRDNSGPSSPFMGAITEIELPPLNEQEARSLVWDGFRAIGIRMIDASSFVAAFTRRTRCYPFLLHCYGERLFHLAQSKKELTVAESNLDEIEHSSAFYRFMQERILENTLHHGHPVFEERLCAYLLATKGAPDESWLTRRFVEEIEKTRESVTPDQTARALASLVRASIFSFGKEGYSLVFPLYREILVNTFPNTRSLREG